MNDQEKQDYITEEMNWEAEQEAKDEKEEDEAWDYMMVPTLNYHYDERN